MATVPMLVMTSAVLFRPTSLNTLEPPGASIWLLSLNPCHRLSSGCVGYNVDSQGFESKSTLLRIDLCGYFRYGPKVVPGVECVQHVTSLFESPVAFYRINSLA
jgi:hypothetical protein